VKLLREATHQLGAAGRKIDPALALAGGREKAVRLAQHLLDLVRAEHHRDDDVAPLKHASGISGDFGASFGERSAGLGADVMDRQLEPGAANVHRHVLSHGAEANHPNLHTPCPVTALAAPR
jgi:hypothetical protein